MHKLDIPYYPNLSNFKPKSFTTAMLSLALYPDIIIPL